MKKIALIILGLLLTQMSFAQDYPMTLHCGAGLVVENYGDKFKLVFSSQDADEDPEKQFKYSTLLKKQSKDQVMFAKNNKNEMLTLICPDLDLYKDRGGYRETCTMIYSAWGKNIWGKEISSKIECHHLDSSAYSTEVSRRKRHEYRAAHPEIFKK